MTVVSGKGFVCSKIIFGLFSLSGGENLAKIALYEQIFDFMASDVLAYCTAGAAVLHVIVVPMSTLFGELVPFTGQARPT